MSTSIMIRDVTRLTVSEPERILHCDGRWITDITIETGDGQAHEITLFSDTPARVTK